MSTFGELRKLEAELSSVCNALKVSIPIGISDRIYTIEMTALVYNGGYVSSLVPEEESLGSVASYEFERLKNKLSPRILRLRQRLWKLCAVK